jgi:predicted Zn-ribbon and HTH transcriptional regulator
MPKERIELSLDSETVKLLRTAAIKKYGNLRSVSRLIGDLAAAMRPIDIKAIKKERKAIRSKHEKMMVLYRNHSPDAMGYDPASWQKAFQCNTCGAEFRITHGDAKYCPMCRSDKVARGGEE